MPTSPGLLRGKRRAVDRRRFPKSNQAFAVYPQEWPSVQIENPLQKLSPYSLKFGRRFGSRFQILGENPSHFIHNQAYLLSPASENHNHRFGGSRCSAESQALSHVYQRDKIAAKLDNSINIRTPLGGQCRGRIIDDLNYFAQTVSKKTLPNGDDQEFSNDCP